MKLLVWIVVLVSPFWNSPYPQRRLVPASARKPLAFDSRSSRSISKVYPDDHGRLSKHRRDRVGLEPCLHRCTGVAGQPARPRTSVLAVGVGITLATAADTSTTTVAADKQDIFDGFIEHRELRLRDERIAANVCVHDGEEDLCATSLPEIHRERCKCDYACGEYDDCCIDNRSITSVDRKWTCYERGGFYAVRACPNSWPNDRVRHRCEEDPDKLNVTVTYLNQLPVFEQKSGLMFWNVFCAICNRKTDLIRPWRRARLVCTNEGLFNRTNFEDRLEPGQHIVNFDASIVEDLVKKGNLTYNVNTEEFTLHNGRFQHDCILDIPEFRDIDFIKTNVLRKCIESITVCQKTFFSKEDQDLAKKCTSYTSYVHDRITARNYKNYHCALCDGVKLWNIRCGAYSNTQNWSVFMVTRTAWPKIINVDLWPWHAGRRRSMHEDKCAHNELYDDLLHVCVYIGCPEQYVWVEEEARCLDILDTLPDPFDNVNLTTTCVSQKIPFAWITELRHKEIRLNHTGRVLRPTDYYVVASPAPLPERNANDAHDSDHSSAASENVGGFPAAASGGLVGYIYYCEPEWLSFELPVAERLTLTVLTYLSAVGLAAVIVLHIVVYELRSSQWGKNVLWLALAALCANVAFACALNKEPFASDCYTTGLATIFFHLAAFFWASAALLDTYRALHNKQPAKRALRRGPSVRKFGTFAWGLALAATIVSSTSDRWGAEFGVGARVGKPLCFITTGSAYALFFYGPIVLVASADLLALLLCFQRIVCRPARPARTGWREPPSSDGVTRTNRGRFYTIAGFLVLSFATWTAVFLAVDAQLAEGWLAFSILYGCQGLWLTVRTALNPTGFWLFLDEVTHRDARHRAMRSAGVLVSSAKDLPALAMPEDHSHHEPTPCPLTPKFSTELSRKALLPATIALEPPSAPGHSRRPSTVIVPLAAVTAGVGSQLFAAPDGENAHERQMALQRQLAEAIAAAAAAEQRASRNAYGAAGGSPTGRHRYGPPVTNLIPATPLPKGADRPRFPHERRVSNAVIKPIHMSVPHSALTTIQPPSLHQQAATPPTGSPAATMRR